MKKMNVCVLFGGISPEHAVSLRSAESVLNNISKDKYRAYCGNVIEDEALCEKIGTGYDVVCANIVADVIIGMSSIFARFMKPDAQLIVSGIIDERLDEVLEALSENGFVVDSQANEEGWNCILLKRA